MTTKKAFKLMEKASDFICEATLTFLYCSIFYIGLHIIIFLIRQ